MHRELRIIDSHITRLPVEVCDRCGKRLSYKNQTLEEAFDRCWCDDCTNRHQECYEDFDPRRER